MQDEGSQLAALALTPRDAGATRGSGGSTCAPDRAARPRCSPPRRCAHGAALEANEISPARAGLVRQALAGVPLEVPVSEEDGRARAADAPATYDRILVDAPCTGLGALRRRPEARWRKSPADVPELTQLQGELLTAAIGALRPGGIVAYVTCSPHLAETAGVVAEVRREFGDAIEELDARAVLDGARRRRPEPAAAGRRLRPRAAVAAPAQHRRDVDHAAAARLSRGYAGSAPAGGPAVRGRRSRCCSTTSRGRVRAGELARRRR